MTSIKFLESEYIRSGTNSHSKSSRSLLKQYAKSKASVNEDVLATGIDRATRRIF